jgi:hypothetical protein
MIAAAVAAIAAGAGPVLGDYAKRDAARRIISCEDWFMKMARGTKCLRRD